METRGRSTPRRFTLAAFALFAVVGFTRLIDGPAAGATIRPTEVDSPIERGGSDLSASGSA